MRQGVLLLLLCVLGVVSARAEGTARAFVEVTSPKRELWLGESVPLTIRVGVDRDFFRDHEVSLFRRKMDVKIQVTAPWLSTASPSSDPAGRHPSFVLGDRVARADRTREETRDGRVFTILEVDRTLHPVAAGTFELAGPTLRYAWSTRFDEDFLGERIPVDRRVETLRGDALRLEVKGLPEAGRPATFVDAVGRYRMGAVLLPAGDEPEAEAAFLVRLEIAGDGDLVALTPPPRAALVGFHVYDVRDEMQDGHRVLTYEVTPVAADVRAVPSLGLPYFDPVAGAYAEARTEPIALPGEDPAVETGSIPEPESSGRANPFLVLGAALVALALIVWVAWGFRRVPKGEEVASTPDPSHDLRRALGEPEPDVARTFATYLAAHLDCPPAAVVSPDLPARLVHAGLGVELAAEASEAIEQLVAARYGGSVAAPDADALSALVERIETALQSSSPS